MGLLTNKHSSLANKKTITNQDLKSRPIMISIQRTTFEDFSLFLSTIEDLNIVGIYNLIYNTTHLVENEIADAICIANLVNTENRNLVFIPIEPKIKAKVFLVYKKYQNQSNALKYFFKVINEKYNKTK